MKPTRLIAQTCAPGGTDMKLVLRDQEYIVLANGANLMSSRMSASEEALASLGCRGLRTVSGASVLVGGLGMGYTLRAALDLLPPDGRAVVAERVPAVVEWNRGPLGPLAGHPLGDRRVHVQIVDVWDLLGSSTSQFDAVLLDVDNGPAALTGPGNDRLYGGPGLALARRALRSGGVLGVWSRLPDRRFERRLSRAGFTLEVHQVRGAPNNRGPRHTIYLGRNRGPGGQPPARTTPCGPSGPRL